ncbi:DeoR/GlpR family DNA-binding transcription regulator [Gayadomonas joobiniege]|uniref:DeoR/GlpR family DNA-binding transcription regulator n=1 Tax=Gayadomonas joobiniege TaxID=1234606 RepID=UPI000474D61C|nr:DeoR family transcriptional regulator [Gayadomonas joobiniege]
MSKRNLKERRNKIVELVNQQGEISVEALAAQFDTSVVTIRKDLTTLEQNGLLLRRFGGAVPLPSELKHNPDKQNNNNKKLIGQAAAKLAKDHYRIIIDSGRTTAQMIPFLTEKQGLVVMTNALDVANQLRQLEPEPTLLMTGGTWDPHSESFQGQAAESVLKSYDFDQLYIGADGLDFDRGTTSFNELLGLSQVMAEQSREVIVMLESEKIGRKMPNVEIAWDKISTVVTDKNLQAAQKEQILNAGVNLIIA